MKLSPKIVATTFAVTLLGLAWLLPHLRHRLISSVTTWDAPPEEPAQLPVGDGPGLSPAPRVRVMLIDGLAASVANTLPGWNAQCKRGVSMTVDVGFPTVSLPVEVALWTGLTQQQTGILFHSDSQLEPPIDRRGIPAQTAGSRAIAESHGWIVRSLGFSRAEPPANPKDHALDADDPTWAARWRDVAEQAVASDAKLVFVHVLEVDDAGHQDGRESLKYRAAAADADVLLQKLVAAAPDARWFFLSDHGHLAGEHGGHGGEEREVRQVAGCIAGAGVTPGRAELVHVVDVSRAIADSVGARLSAGSRGRPLSVALASPLAPDQAIPPMATKSGALAIALLVIGACASIWAARWWLVPWWYIVALASFVFIRGVPTLSTPMTYAPTGREMYVTWLPALAIAAVSTWFGLGRTTIARVVVSQLALPAAAVAAAVTACGAWSLVLGAESAPIVPLFTAALSPLLLILAHGCAAAGLAVLGRTVRSVIGRRGPQGTEKTASAAG
jgi:hypothetical protein